MADLDTPPAGPGSLANLVLDRLGTHPLAGDAEDLLLAALLGDDVLDEAAGGDSVTRPPNIGTGDGGEPQTPAGAYLTSVSVRGFRGIGPEATLPLQPGPGLTVVCGRNGSGKSSFAEALEVLLTGKVRRLEERSAVWQDTWRCLHDGDPRVEATLAVAGIKGATRVTCTWDHDEAITGAQTRVQVPGEAAGGLELLGWGEALTVHRPFLSHAELEVMLARPSDLHDQLNDLLGLKEVAVVVARLVTARKRFETVSKAPAAQLASLKAALADLDDQRATDATALLAAKEPDLVALTGLAAGRSATADPALDTLAAWRLLAVPDPAAVASAAAAIDNAEAQLDEVRRTDAADAAETAQLLSAAMAHVARHGPGDCPVCGTVGAIGDGWFDAAADRITRLEAQSHVLIGAQRALGDAVSTARSLIAPFPISLAAAPVAGVDPAPAAAAWRTWAAPPDDPGALAAHLLATRPPLDTVARLAADAATVVESRHDRWSPVATALATWIAAEADARTARDRIKEMKNAESWLRDANDQFRNDRLAPYTTSTKAIWRQLRQASNVDITSITLTGSATRRAVDFAVTVDEQSRGSLAVLSQGELNSLALSIFLPRATSDASPLRFVVVDDPVQAMDPSKVAGLAQVLAEAAVDRQVVVFSHDDRLPDALRQLSLPARIVEVARRPGSVVEVIPCDDPASRLLADAGGLAKGDQIPHPVAERVVPDLCRTALEETCFEILRRRRLGRGDTHGEVEDTLIWARRLLARLALAIYDDADRGGEVYAWLDRRIGTWATRLVKDLNYGAHHGTTDSGDLVGGTRRIIAELRTKAP